MTNLNSGSGGMGGLMNFSQGMRQLYGRGGRRRLPYPDKQFIIHVHMGTVIIKTIATSVSL